MKKALCVIIAMIIAFSSLAVVSFAAAPDISMMVKGAGNAKAGDVITVEVKVPKKSNLIAATLYLVYDNEFFKLVSMAPIEESMQPIVNMEFAKNKALYAGVHIDRLRDAATLFTAQFEVLKRGGKISLEADEVYYITDGQRTEVTKEVNDKLKDDAVTITCPHNEKTTTNVSDPTCAVEGKKVETCKECGLKTDIAIPKLAHTGTDVVVIKETSCKEPGTKGKKCTVCGQTFDETTIPALPHNMEEVVIKDATCKEAGTKGKKCTVCGFTSDETTIPALPHDMKEVVIKDATCKEEGKKVNECKVCGFKSDETAISVLPHDVKVVVIEDATCEGTGKQVEKCKNCEYVGKETAIPATGHVEGKWVVVKNPTKTEPGLEEQKCDACGKVLNSREIPVGTTYKLGDVNEDGKITAVDARVVLRQVAGLVELNSAQKLAADTNKDGEVSATDARLILQYVVGMVKF
jgi:hypothetical protein